MIRMVSIDELDTEFDKAIAWFNFERVVITMNALNWKGYQDEFGYYKIDLMKIFVKSLYSDAIKMYQHNPLEKYVTICSGGFQVSIYTNDVDGPGVCIEFVVASSESYKDML